MKKRRRLLWVILFVWVAILLGIMATGWNVVLVQDYYKMLSLARGSIPKVTHAPWIGIILGWLAYASVLGILVLFFWGILREIKLNQLQSEFLATVSHELKTPIAALELSSTLIQSGDLPIEELEKLWQTHRTELRRLREEVEALLEAARWQNKPQMKKRSWLNLESWITDSWGRWERILGPHAQLKREGEPLNCNAYLDLKTFNLITDNILDNARKFAKDRVEVTIKTKNLYSRFFRKKRWQIRFEDHGFGFDPANARKLFLRFFRGPNSSDHAIPGTGLGLHLAKSATGALGLKLKAESEGPGKGATFILEGPERVPKGK